MPSLQATRIPFSTLIKALGQSPPDDPNSYEKLGSVIPIPNQQNCCYLVSVLHLLLRDKQLQKGSPSNSSRFNDVRTMSNIIGKLDNSRTNITDTLRALNQSRRQEGMA